MEKTKAAEEAEVKKATWTAFLCLTLILALFCSVASVFAQTSPHAGNIRITPDGSVEGTDKISRDNNVYTLVGDLSGAVENGRTFISIERDNVVFDGAGKTIRGSGTGIAIAVYGKKDVTIKNTRIINFGTGIELRAFDWNFNTTGTNNRIIDNYLETTYWGIDLNVNNGVVSGNKIVSTKSYYGVNFCANNTVFSNNEFVKGGLVIFEPCYQNLFSNNTVNGRPLVYLERQANQVIDGAAQVVLIDCNNMLVRNVPPTVGLRMTITLLGTSNTQITNCVGNIALKNSHSNLIINNELRTDNPIASFQDSALELTFSHNNTIADNSITAMKGYGISIVASVHNKIRGNDIASTGYAAIKIEVVQQTTSPSQQIIPEYNYVYENNITCTESGISLRSARNTVVFKNSIYNCKDAIMLSGSHKNQFLGNNITGSSQYGIHITVANDNTFYHNNFLNN
ncbi:MAG: NosD domain-containing protein, partial [Candidatus Bathyarchaeia archaeon]